MSNSIVYPKPALKTWPMWLAVGLLLCALALGGATSAAAQEGEAAESAETESSSCARCHEEQYYNFDTGKWFCQCTEKMDCTCCHGGDPSAATEEAAHLNMSLRPASESGITCQGCHPDDYQDRLVTFDEIAGIHSMHVQTPVIPPFEVPQSAALPENGLPRSELLAAPGVTPWQMAGLGVVGLTLVVLTFCGLRCWRKEQNS